MKWDLATDTYGIRVCSMPSITTKRELLSAISLIFDPLGICLPVVTAAKLLFQQTQVFDDPSSRCWDKPLPVDLLAKWKTWVTSLENTSFPYVNRSFRPVDFPLKTSIFRLVVDDWNILSCQHSLYTQSSLPLITR